MIRIGTSGYNHREWIGSFYPADMGPARYLARYAEEFDLCEIPMSSHHLPHPAEAERILGESKGELLFTALAPVCLIEGLWASGAHAILPGANARERNEPPAVGAGFLGSDGDSPEIAGRDFALRGGARREGPAYAAWGESSRAWGARERSQAMERGGRLDRGGGAGWTNGRALGPVPAEGTFDRYLVRLRDGLLPYVRAGRFGGIVLSLPRRLPATEETLAAIARCCDRLEDVALLIEPHEASWAAAASQDRLRGFGIGFALADGPDPAGPAFGPDRGGARPLPARRFVTFAPVTAGVAYVRFHGRYGGVSEAETTRKRGTGSGDGARRGGNAVRRGTDLAGKHAERTPRRDYLYSSQELVEWLPTLRALAARSRELFVVFANSGRERAIDNARTLRRLIGSRARPAAALRLWSTRAEVLGDPGSSPDARGFPTPMPSDGCR